MLISTRMFLVVFSCIFLGVVAACGLVCRAGGRGLLVAGLLLSPVYGSGAAEGVISRYAGQDAQVVLETLPGGGEHEFEAVSQGGKLIVRGNSPVALCRGFYTAVRQSGRGICSWRSAHV